MKKIHNVTVYQYGGILQSLDKIKTVLELGLKTKKDEELWFTKTDIAYLKLGINIIEQIKNYELDKEEK